jgi:hypothetical protein
MTAFIQAAIIWRYYSRLLPGIGWSHLSCIRPGFEAVKICWSGIGCSVGDLFL